MTDAVARAKTEIRRDVASGLIPATVGSFGELHDYVDANEYGGLCDEGSSESLSHDEWIEWGISVQEELDAWIRKGGLR